MLPKRAVLVGALCAFSLYATSSHADIKWYGDYSTNNFLQWGNLQCQAPLVCPARNSAPTSGPLQLWSWSTPAADMPPPLPWGPQIALRVDIAQIPYPTNSTVRAEASGSLEGGSVALYGSTTDNSQRYYSWSTYIPTGFPDATATNTNLFHVLTQWHHQSYCWSPPLGVNLGRTTARNQSGPYALTLDSVEEFPPADPAVGQHDDRLWSATLKKGVWHNFVVHVFWSSTYGRDGVPDGWVEFWHSTGTDAPVYQTLQACHTRTGDPKCHRRTLFNWGSGRALCSQDTSNPALKTDGSVMYNYLKQGLYRDNAEASEEIIWHKGMVVTTGPPAGLVDAAVSGTSGPFY